MEIQITSLPYSLLASRCLISALSNVKWLDTLVGALTLEHHVVYMHDMRQPPSIECDVLVHCACHKLRRAARKVTRTYDDALRPVGLRATQLSVLVAISVAESVSITGIASYLSMDRTTLTRNVRPLEKDGLVVIEKEGQYRSRKLRITEQGRKLMSEAFPLWIDVQQRLENKIGTAAFKDLATNLERVIYKA